MPLDLAEEKRKLEKLIQRRGELNTRFDEDYKRFVLDPSMYLIPKTEGEWDNFISNRCSAEGNKIIDTLSYARRKLWIPLEDETKQGRNSLTATEQLANGVLFLIDNLAENTPEGQSVQASLSYFRPVRGWSAQRILLRMEDDKLVPDYAAWDIRNTYWIASADKLIKVFYIRYADEDEVKFEYPSWTGTAQSTNDKVEIVDIWDCTDKTAKEGVWIGNEWVKEPTEVKIGDTTLDYLPIRIRAGRSAPLIGDNLKNIGESFQVNNRGLYSTESRLISYEITRAGQLAKAPRVVVYDSSTGQKPEGFEKDPYTKGRTLYLDKAKGEEWVNAVPPPTGSEIVNSTNIVQGLEGIGGFSAVAYGVVNQALPAQGIDILSKSTSDIVKPFKQGVESDIKWLAEEIVRQFKNGDFGEYEFEGYDKSANRFKTKVKPDDIDVNWKFECELVPDLLRDKATNIGNAELAVKSGLMSKQTARDEFALVTDTDLEAEKIAKEQVEGIVQFKLRQYEAALLKDGDIEGAAIVRQEIEKLSMQAMNPPQEMGGVPASRKGVPQPPLIAANQRPMGA